jgi:hypothetical protein
LNQRSVPVHPGFDYVEALVDAGKAGVHFSMQALADARNQMGQLLDLRTHAIPSVL